MWESVLFLHFQRKKEKFIQKIDAARFLDARGDEKQVINLERPKYMNGQYRNANLSINETIAKK